MERMQASIGRLILFSTLITVTILLTITRMTNLSSARHKQILAMKSIPRLTAFPTPIDTPTPTLLPIPTNIPTSAPTTDPQSDAIWEKLADCESHQNWTDDTGNGYYGGLQFSKGAWESVGGVGKPSDASRDEQIMRGKMLQLSRGWSPWGACSKVLELY